MSPSWRVLAWLRIHNLRTEKKIVLDLYFHPLSPIDVELGGNVGSTKRVLDSKHLKSNKKQRHKRVHISTYIFVSSVFTYLSFISW